MANTNDRSMFGWYREADKKTRRVFWTCSAGWAMDMADGVVYGFLIPVLMIALGMTLQQAGFIASANFFSAALGGWIAGWLCDRYGRARILQLTILWFSVFSFASGFAQNYEQMLIIRILQGFGFGGEWAVGAVLLGELIKPEHRGKALGTVHSGAAVGSGIAAVLAGPFAALFDPDWGWRIVFWIGIAPAALIFFIRKGTDDSEVFRKSAERAKAKGESRSIGAIFGSGMFKITALAAILSLGVQGAAYSIGNYVTSFLHLERELSMSIAGTLALVLAAGGFFGFLSNAYLSDIVGRRKVFRWFAIGFLLAALLFLFAPLGSNIPLLAMGAFVYGFFQFGMYASFGPYFTELFPTEMRGTGQAFAYNFGRAASGIFIMGIPLLAMTIALSTAMFTFAAVGVMFVLVASFLLPETVGSELKSLGDKDTLVKAEN